MGSVYVAPVGHDDPKISGGGPPSEPGDSASAPASASASESRLGLESSPFDPEDDPLEEPDEDPLLEEPDQELPLDDPEEKPPSPDPRSAALEDSRDESAPPPSFAPTSYCDGSASRPPVPLSRPVVLTRREQPAPPATQAKIPAVVPRKPSLRKSGVRLNSLTEQGSSLSSPSHRPNRTGLTGEGVERTCVQIGSATHIFGRRVTRFSSRSWTRERASPTDARASDANAIPPASGGARGRPIVSQVTPPRGDHRRMAVGPRTISLISPDSSGFVRFGTPHVKVSV